MGLKCSLLGHSFDETDVERDREERGNEVVTVVREVERCSRCGQARVLSENKEVTSIVEPDEVGLDGAPDGTGSSSTALGNAAADVDDEGWSGGDVDAGGEVGEAYEPPEDPSEEDAEILRDDGSPERRPGQWPDDDEDWSPDRLTGGGDGSNEADDPGVNIADDVTADPDVLTDDGPAGEGTDAGGAGDDASTEGDVAPDDDAEFIDADADAARRAASEEGDERASEDASPDRGVAGTGDAGSSPSAATPGRGDGTYVCPECGFTRRAENSPLREGDACPECQRGYLVVEDR